MSLRELHGAKAFHATRWGQIVHGDSLDVLPKIADGSVNLIMTSPPFGLVRKNNYGNVDANNYVEWFRPFGEQFSCKPKDGGGRTIATGRVRFPSGRVAVVAV